MIMTTPAMVELIVRHQMVMDYSEDGFGDLCMKLDLLHDAASIGRVEMVTDLPLEALRGWLREIIFIARETLVELESTRGDAIWN
jgi:hypothetical protein